MYEGKAERMKLIDADALERDGWMMHRTVQVDKYTMSYQVKKPTDFHVIEPERRKGKWITQQFGSWAECSECHELYDIPIAISNFCPNCGADMRGEQE